MADNKFIKRDPSTSKLFDERSLQRDYATLTSLLKPGLKVLDVGCGTGAISKDIANIIGPQGHITGIDNTGHFIESGKGTYKDVENLELIHTDLFDFHPEEKFDLIVSARTIPWLSNPQEAVAKMKSMLKPGGWLSVLDYDHTELEWTPEPPLSMRRFYATFLRWRSDAGMNNEVAEDAKGFFEELGFRNIEVLNADEVYEKGQSDFEHKISIWSKVAAMNQIVEEGYISDADRLQAIEDYNQWVAADAKQMIMKLKETRGQVAP
ncbi:methyltransferase domain-containing protein [Mucilaginibacter agri]|uniref:Methyltransferase domain-containing protein n=1 Tax=Mucilaginibacter agri TaxID=2695265 RepID=A0A965ZHY0_9SPHI|nr:methyltransferase domain-containing protein [Mucilaginibacter agri]NCD71418.1 methyltransferase domain-containing protein [Mucilaginibacter agri]